MDDELAFILVPPAVYWTACVFFHLIEILAPSKAEEWSIVTTLKERKAFTQTTQKNTPSRSRVIIQVFIQQLIQVVVTIIMVYYVSPAPQNDQKPPENNPYYIKSITRIFFGALFYDSWQYWVHRLMHVSKSLYKHVHSVHHRLIIPYSYSALYNHPIEALLLDIVGGAVTLFCIGLTNNEATLLFSFAMIKTVDDHCGMDLWWDPLQRIFTNNAIYHYIHHQHVGLKSNFSQPFFSFWDTLCGTEWKERN
jgi:sphinganine C4-monooxygenase